MKKKRPFNSSVDSAIAVQLSKFWRVQDAE